MLMIELELETEKHSFDCICMMCKDLRQRQQQLRIGEEMRAESKRYAEGEMTEWFKRMMKRRMGE